ncbi:MAG: hypothetical protein GY722_12640 [bacterium]|nr:hypothetical protein [bacterium]
MKISSMHVSLLAWAIVIAGALVPTVGFGQQTMFVTDNKVGIGIDDPIALLHLSSATAENFWFSAPNLGYLLEDTNSADDQRIVQFLFNNGRFRIRGLRADYSQNVHGITLSLGDNGGNVGIGTSTPASRLHVSGGDVLVSGGSFIDDGTILEVPDYVFAPDYRLPPLGEVAEFVAREKHLPGIPSAAKIRENGLNLAQFQMKLLEKIEELTLYTLEQEERIARLERLLERDERLTALDEKATEPAQ